MPAKTVKQAIFGNRKHTEWQCISIEEYLIVYYFLWQIISIDKWLTYNKLLAITYPVISQIYYDNGAFI